MARLSIIPHVTRFKSTRTCNHSCAPNTYVDWKGLCLRALRDIDTGEELTCNYLTTDWDLHEKFVCTCGSPDCYGEIRGFKYLSPEQRRALEQFVPEFMKKRISMTNASEIRLGGHTQ